MQQGNPATRVSLLSIYSVFFQIGLMSFGGGLVTWIHREAGLTPVAAGLVFAGAIVLLKLGEAKPLAWLTVVFVAGLLTWRPTLHPLLLIGAGGVIFLLIHLATG